MYKACIFDLDGTLANTLASIANFANTALEKCGYETIPVDKYRYLVGNGAVRLMHNMLDTVCGADGYNEEDVRRLREVYDALYEENPTLLVTNYPGMRETAEKLKSTGIKMAVLSNKPHNCTTAIVEALYGRGLFDCCYGQRPKVARKPAPDGALLIADELQIEPKDFLYIGDTNTDMKTGAAAGMDTVGVLWGFRDEKELKENHAKFIIERPEQIYRIAASCMR
ncbi:HAD family hydrolase [Caproiciproducens galactitolivorans]|uniref:HAD family hydrolase n=1 Tax=Caproiciproducens galactitolivorans TaxID=642589 RepID=A0ABT4BQU9_9FIRM|nr:HAD family hydrolase [Caproiciproducens galactitolivorans]MCY1713271.1 HAD family hydrolase [Caproiciproducens galactitolivorans]